jgi:tRNA modification GTPase
MFATDDTIVAIATPPGRGGIGVVRVSGSAAREISARILVRRAPLKPREATFTRVRLDSATRSRHVDQVVATLFPAPNSYTGEDVVEISAHGSPIVLQEIVGSLVDAGARLARPGEFTLRAFLGGRMDLVQAEAVGDLIDAVTPLQARQAFEQLEGSLSRRIRALDQMLLDLVAVLEASLDFPEEGFHFIDAGEVAWRIGTVVEQLEQLLAHQARGRLIRDGATVVLTGRANAGKSSLFNALIGQDRAIVSSVPGTTRDLLTERIDLLGLAITLVDTAGIREADDQVERQGVDRAVGARRAADLLLVVLDSGDDLNKSDRDLLDQTARTNRILVGSKADRPRKWHLSDAVNVSAHDGNGIPELRQAIVSALSGGEALSDGAALSNLRHVALLHESKTALDAATAAASAGLPEEIVLGELHRARATLSEVIGSGGGDEVLDYIFSRFCIGK